MGPVNSRRPVLLALMIMLLLAPFGSSLAKASDAGKLRFASEPMLRSGLPAPAFSLADAEGRTYTVGGEREKPLIVNFWASWCGPCKEEAPWLSRLAEKYKDALEVYAVNVTNQDDKQSAERFIETYGLAMPVLFDLKGDVFTKYRGIAFPTNILIGRDGKITEVIIGLLPPEELERKIIDLTRS